MIRLEMLPAGHGDCLLLEYGRGDDVEHRIVIDGGPRNHYAGVRGRLADLPLMPRAKRRDVDLLVVTHVDADHIEGVISFLQDDDLSLNPDDIWFNDWQHLAPLTDERQRLGASQGEFLGALLREQHRPWNSAFDGGVVMVPSDPDEPLPTWRGPKGLRLTVLSPTLETLVKLRRKWESAIEAAGFRPGDHDRVLEQFGQLRWAAAPRTDRLGDESRRSTLDHSEANGSSIALLVEFGGRSILLAGDAFANVLRENIERLQRERGLPGEPLHVDVFKLPHHGSASNATPQLMAVLSADAYAISTNGAIFGHPDRDAVEIIVKGHRGANRPTFLCNFRSRQTGVLTRRKTIDVRYEQDSVIELATA